MAEKRPAETKPFDSDVDPHIPRIIEDTHLSKRVWLVKVPKYVAEKMSNTQGCVGKIKMPTTQGADVTFVLNDQPANTEQTPTAHKFITTKGFNQSLQVLSESRKTGKLVLEGKVVQRMECKPHGDKNYMEFKKRKVEECNKPTRYVMELSQVPVTYKPISNHAHQIEAEAQKKAQGKRARDEPAIVKEMLFKAFEKHQYYSLKNLVDLTRQPVEHLKDILKQICVYNLKAPHKNLYELKPEFRHYGEDDG